MDKVIIRIALTASLLGMGAAHAGDFSGGYFGAKMGINNSSATGATVAPNQKSVAYFMQGGYLQGGYNLDLSSVVVGVGAYGDWNSYATHSNGVAYGSRAFGFDAKLGVPVGNWLPYAKFGHGHSSGTDDLSAVAQSNSNTAFGFEYKLASHWSTIGEYKINNFSSQDGSTTINNKTITFGLNYYFVAPPEPEPVPEPVAAPEPEPAPELALLPAAPPVSEVLKAFMEEKAVRIDGDNFASGTSKLELVSAKERLSEVVDYAGKHPNTNLEVTGYFDNSGTEEMSKKLSLERAKSVKKYLVDNGVAPDRIAVKGEGSANPVGDNNTADGRAQNRRVEILAVARKAH